MQTFTYPNSWNTNNIKTFSTYFQSLKVEEHIDFDTRISRTRKKVLGIRVPVIRQIAKEIAKTDISSFLDCYTPTYHEEYLLYAFMITKLKDYTLFVPYFEAFLPHIDNWAVCDLLVGDSKIIAKHLDTFLPHIMTFLQSPKEFVRRVGIVCLMKYYLSKEWIDNTLSLLQNYHTQEYYINMALGWLICEAYIKDKEKCTSFLLNCNLYPLAIRYGLQKIRDSYRVEGNDKIAITNQLQDKISNQCVELVADVIEKAVK